MKDSMKYIHQAEVDPIETIEGLTEFLSALEPLPEDRKIGILTDENGKNEIVFIFTESILISLRLNLSEEQEKQAFLNLTLNKR
ncbi:hypothetical protein A8139_06415 [Marinomonas primoryensis]|uniref:Uncharacterized protein n=1 Tax=Marinomonas primoryensis TaxID=178399 RepID=A0A2Z4PQ75_9GAMM|nr:hypothetical protein [Marinomonas primoryensis]AWX99671.1 hypothetical protein A8139_06415 [Marinomonas primoryensis]